MNTSEFITAVRRSGQLQAADPTYTDAVILEEGTQAIIERFMEPVTALRQGYWLQRVSQTADPTNTSGLYRLPPRAVVQGLELLEISVNNGTSYHQLNLLTQTQSVGFTDNASGSPHSYVLESDCVRLIPAPDSAILLRMRYYLRPPNLIAFTDTCRVVSVTANVIVVNSNPATEGISTSTGLDVQDADGSHEIALVGATVASITGPVLGNYTITLSPASIDTGRVSGGDFVRAPDQAVFPMLVKELHRPLADYVAGVIRLSKGDRDKAGMLTQKAQSGIDRVVAAAQPRIKNSPFSFRRNSYLRRNVGWWGGGR